VGALLAFSRSLLFGSATAAQAYMDARSDPLGPIIALFEKLVGAIERPVVVFIDDLDRCDGTYVIALLEGIQTLFRTRRVTYVIAADRKWICSCFEKRYADFSKTIGEPGRPLRYLFLDKVFQVSASVPRVSAQMQESYWQSLLRAGASTQPSPTEIDKIQKQEQRKAEVAAKLSNGGTCRQKPSHDGRSSSCAGHCSPSSLHRGHNSSASRHQHRAFPRCSRVCSRKVK
jgi:KAP-like P-loop domain-containing protein